MFKVLSLFSGIGAFEKALENIDEPFELVNYCEIDKYASKSYSLIHGVPEELNLVDVTKVDTSKLPNDISIVTYGFPCQDISISGKQKGFTNEDGSLTRSGLFFEALRIIEDTKPLIAIAENVKALVSKKFTKEFQIVLDSLEAAVWSLITTETLEEALLKAVNLGDDSDTVGAIAGGLAALYYGYENVPDVWKEHIIKEEEIVTLCESMEEKFNV